MVEEYRRSFYSFVLGMVAIHGAALFFVWMAFPPPPASILTGCVVMSLTFLFRYSRRLMLSFALPPEALRTGKFDGDEAARAGTQSGVHDAGEIRTLSRLISQQQHLTPSSSATTPSSAGVPASPAQ